MREQDYKKVLTNFIEEERKTIGQVAETKANEASFLTVEDDGTITFDDGIGEPELRELVDIFHAFQGDSVKGIVKRAAEKSRIEPSFLPADILPPSRDRAFWAIGAGFVGILIAIALFAVRHSMFKLHGAFIMNLVGPGFMSVREPAFLFSLGVAFVIGMAHDLIPCSVPVWTTLLPSGEHDDKAAPGAFFARSLRYFIGSAAVLATFGFLLGLFGASVRPLLQSITGSALRFVIAGVFFSAVGIVLLFWGLAKLDMVESPSIGIHQRLLSLADKGYVDRSIINGVVFGGVEVSCPFPTYHLLLLWAIIVGNPLYGAVLLTVFILGKLLPIIVIGLFARTNGGAVFDRFKIGHDVFHIANGALLIATGTFLLFVMGQMLFIGPKGHSPVIVFRMLQAVFGIGIAYTAGKIYSWTNPHGWKYLGYSGIVLALWSFVSLPAYAAGWQQPMIDAVGAMLFAVLISLSLTHFVDTDLPLHHPAWFRMKTVLLYLLVVGAGAIGTALTLYGVGQVSFSLLYGASALLFIPALIGIVVINRQSRLQTWNKFLRAILLLGASVLMSLYNASACAGSAVPACAGYEQAFVMPAVVPVVPVLVKLALLAPLLALLGVFYFAEGSFVFYHRMYEPVQKAVKIEGNKIEQLIRGTVDRNADMIGEEMSQRIVEEALGDIDGLSIDFKEGEPQIRMAVDIENEEMFANVREQLSEAFSERVGDRAVEQVDAVADEVQGIAAAQSDDSTYTCDVCGREFDSERGLHVHEAKKHDD